jgi:hypothetical protein
MPQIQRFKYLPITTTGAGANVIIPAVTGKPIDIWKIVLFAATAVTVVVEDNAGTPNLYTGALPLAVGVPLTLQYDGAPHFSFLPGNAAVLFTGGAGIVTGFVQYTVGA